MSTKVSSADELPTKPGVYIMRDANDEIIYVGKSKSLKNRVKSYFREVHDTPKTHVMMSHFNNLEYIVTSTEKEALILEATLISKHKPRYNIRLKDDKRYPYIKITDEDFPRLIVTRTVTRNGKYYGPFVDVTSLRNIVKYLKTIFKIRRCKSMNGPCLNSQIDLCYAPCDGKISKKEYNDNIGKIDLFFQGNYKQIVADLRKEMIKSSNEQKFEKAAQIRDQINGIKDMMEKQFVSFSNNLNQDIIAGSYDKDKAIIVVISLRDGRIVDKDDFLMTGVEERTPQDILSAFIKQYYANPRRIPQEILLEHKINDKKLVEEWLSDLNESHILDENNADNTEIKISVPEDGPEYKLIRMASKNASIIKNQKQQMQNALIDLKKYLKLSKLPKIIEGYDVSNISGTLAVGSKVSFYDGKPKKSKYKRFNLKTPGPDDYGMMRELLTRRFKLLIKEKQEDSNHDIPNLVLIDGGKGQLNVAVEVLRELGLDDIPVMGLAKEFEEIHLPQIEEPLRLPRDSESLYLLQRIRDESHRFAITQHRNLRSKNISYSELDDIKGIGERRKTNLLKHFGDLDSIKKASFDEILEVKGMTKTSAENVYEYFN